MEPRLPVWSWPELDTDGLTHGFVGRVPGVDVLTDRDTALARLAAYHHKTLELCGAPAESLATAEQVHGAGVGVVTHPVHAMPGVDALVTRTPGVTLGIYVADCAAVYFVDSTARVIGLAHSGKKGTEQNIVAATLTEMLALGARRGTITAVVSPCIRPPHYEVDFAAIIRAQLRDGGVARVVDDQVCTAADPLRFYSYRRESGKTGRMLAFLRLSA